MDLSNIAAFCVSFVGVLSTVGLLISAFIYLRATAKGKGEQIDDETIKRLNNAIEALERENQSLRNENTIKDQRLAAMQIQIDQSKEKILNLADMVSKLPVAPIAPVAPVAPVLPVAPVAPIAPLNNNDMDKILCELTELKRQFERQSNK